MAEVYTALGVTSRAVVKEVRKEDLVAGYVGQTMEKCRSVFREAKGGVLVIDEAYEVVAGSSDGGDGYGCDVIAALMAYMDEGEIVVLLGYQNEMDRF